MSTNARLDKGHYVNQPHAAQVKGGTTTLARHGIEHYRAIGAKGAAKRTANRIARLEREAVRLVEGIEA